MIHLVSQWKLLVKRSDNLVCCTDVKAGGMEKQHGKLAGNAWQLWTKLPDM